MALARTADPAGVAILRYLLACGSLAIIGIPVLYGFLSAFKQNSEILLSRFLPETPYFGNFLRVLADPRMLRAVINSFYICALALVIGCALSLLAAVPIARRPERIFRVFYAIFLSSMIIPAIAGFVALYVMMAKTRLVNNTTAVSVLYAAQFMVPIGVLIFASFLRTVPLELEEAAKMEGCGYFSRILHVTAPLIRAPVLSLAVLQLPAVWNEFLIPLLFLRKQEVKPLTLLIYNFTRDHESDYGAIFALIVLGMIVPLTLFLIARRKIEEGIGITAGGVKG